MFRRLAAITAALVLLGGCTAAPGANTPAAATSAAPAALSALLDRHQLSGKSAREVVEALDASPAQRPTALRASVKSGQLLLSDATGQATMPIPGTDFYLSIAPYASRTHECYFHNLGTCQGELAGADVHVTITDAGGKTLVDKQVTTYANGFTGFWLPRDISGTVTVTAASKTGSVPFATRSDSATCLTTLKVA